MNKRQDNANKKRRNHDGVDMVTICLSDGPKTIPQLEQYFIELPRRFGMFIELFDRESLEMGHLTDSITQDLEKMIKAGLVEKNDQYYQLTSEGQKKFSVQSIGLREIEHLLRMLGSPSTVGKVSLAIHLILAAIKLPAGIISGSIGLLNDAVDTLLDGLSSILVLLGMRFKQESISNIILIALMLITGGLAMFEAVQRVFLPVPPNVDGFTFFSALISALLCAGLYLYQRYVGLRSGSLALITQSVDSRNHVIVAASVTAGLIAALFDFPWLDTIVGLLVAAIILYSACEIAFETIKNMQTDTVDLSRFSMGITERYDQFRTNQLRAWLLYLMQEENIHERIKLKTRALMMLDFSSNPALSQIGLNIQTVSDQDLETEIAEMIRDGLLRGSVSLDITNDGKKYLSKMIRPGKYGRRHSPRNT